MEVAVTTDAGAVGRDNEDSWSAEQLHRNVTLLAVADGFGSIRGSATAGVALEAICGSIRRELRAAMPPRSLTGSDVRDLLVTAFADANQRLLQFSGGGEDHVSAASTCTAVLVVGNQAFIAHIGDSRAYLFRRGELVQLTTDESIIPDLVTSSAHRQGRYKPLRPLLVRALGIETKAVQPKVTHYTLHARDAMLFCTDGAHRSVSGSDLAAALSNRDQPAEWVTDRILTLARAAGSTDNATVLLARDATEHGAPGQSRPRPVSRAPSFVPLLAAGVGAVLLLTSVLWTADTKLYLGREPGGQIALFSGLPATVLGVPLHVVRNAYRLSTRALPAGLREQLDGGIWVQTPAAASSLVSQWQSEAKH